MNTAHTILQQLGGNRFIAMTGARDFLGRPDGLSFRVPSTMTREHISHVRVTLNALDTYDVEYLKIRGTTIRTIAKSEGIYCDMLARDFADETGLAVSL